MTIEETKNPFADPAGLTAQNVIDRVSSDGSLTWRTKRELDSALNVTASWLHLTPQEIPASHEYLRRAYSRLSRGALGVSDGRFRNVQSLVKRALIVAGVPTSGRSYLRDPTPAWQALLSAIPSSYDRQCLSRFARFASCRHVEPGQVTDAIVETFHEALRKEDLTAKPDVATQSAVRIWNRLVDRLPVHNLNRLTPLVRRETYSLRSDQLPQAFISDLDRYLEILSGMDPTHPLAPPRPLRVISLKTRRYQFIQLISALYRQGGCIDEIHSLADLCQIDRIRLALQFFIARERNRHGKDADPATSMIHGLADAARAAARHYVKAPNELVAELTRIAQRLNPGKAGMCEKARVRLTQMEAPHLRGQLVVHPQAEMQKLAELRAPTRQDAIRFGALLAIEILNVAPMRIENLAHLDLERHFIWPPKDRGDIGIVIYSPIEVKNRMPLEYRLTGGSAAAFRCYLKRFRPLLVGPATSTALFPGRSGRPKRNDTLSKQITKLLHTELGITWHPHLFRHHAARNNLNAYPGDYEGSRRLLGHRNAETTYRFYEGMEMRPAVARYDRLLESIRGPAPFKS